MNKRNINWIVELNEWNVRTYMELGFDELKIIQLKLFRFFFLISLPSSYFMNMHFN